ncbi:MFS transporter [Schlesneria sp. T3-172]|uniref:MFS transporter n=1 Tax=Schlesneria sphaerica TaxID=3373610 RepID=UPI0037C9A199
MTGASTTASTSLESQQTTSDVALRPTNVRYGVLGLLCGLSMITYIDRVCFASAASGITRDFGLSGQEQLKWAYTAFAIAYGLFELPAGWLGDRLGPRSTLLRIVIWWSLFTAATGLVGLKFGSLTLGGLTTLIVIRFLFGAGEAGAYPNITRAIHNWFPMKNWETAQGYIWMSGRIAGGVTPLVWAILVSGTTFSTPLLNWRGAFLFFCGLGLVWCVVFAWWFRDQPANHPAVNAAERELIGSTWTPHSHSNIPVKAMLKNRSLWALCLMYSLINYGWFFNVSYFPSYLKDRFQLSEGDLLGAVYAGAPLWVGAIGCISGGIIISFIAERIGDRRRARQIVGCTAMLVCALSWWSVYQAKSIHQFCISISLAALCVDLTLGAAWATCQDLGRQHAAVTGALMNTVGTVGSSLAAWLTGEIVQRYVKQAAASGTEALTAAEKYTASMAGYQAVFFTYASVYVIAALCWCFINASKPLEPEQAAPQVGGH